ELGFVDELGNFQDAVERAKMLGRISGPANLIEYQQRYDISDIFRLFGKTETPVLKVDLGFEPPKLQVGQLYFLAPNFVHSSEEAAPRANSAGTNPHTGRAVARSAVFGKTAASGWRDQCLYRHPR